MKKIICILMMTLMSSSVFASSDSKTRVRSAVFQELAESDSFSECASRNWIYNRKLWYGGYFTFNKVLLTTKWLEDESGNIIEGSLEKLILKEGHIESTDGVHRSEISALNECKTILKLIGVSSFSKLEVQEAIDRFLKN